MRYSKFFPGIKFEISIISWLNIRHALTITFVIIRYTKKFLKYPSRFSEERNICKTDRRLQLRAKIDELPKVQDIDLSGITISIE